VLATSSAKQSCKKQVDSTLRILSSAGPVGGVQESVTLNILSAVSTYVPVSDEPRFIVLISTPSLSYIKNFLSVKLPIVQPSLLEL
jgi:hypothetical protein